MRWDDLAVFLAAYRERHLGRAGRRLGVDPSTVSRRIAALEEALGGALFVRTPDGMLPTDAAEALLPAAERAEAAVHEIDAVAASRSAAIEGTVRVAMTEGTAHYLVARELPGLLTAHPGLGIEIVASIGLADLSRREADLALRFVRPTRGDLFARRLRSDRYGVFGHRDYVAAHRDLPLDALDWVTWGEPWEGIAEARWYREVVGVTPRLRANAVTVLWEAVRAGLGVGLATAMVTHFAPELDEVPTPQPIALRAETWLVGHAALRDVPRVRLVADWLAELVGRWPET